MYRERRSGFLAALATASLLLTAPPAAAAEDHLTGAASLQPFYLALSALEQKRSPRPVRVMQIGDSHTANDAFSGRMRERLQARFGASGRGWLPAGIPFKYYRPNLVTVSETGWRHLRPSDGPDSEPLGIDAIAAQVSDPAAQMTLTSTEAEGFDRVAIEVVTAPHGAPLTVRVDDDAVRRIATDAPNIALRRFEMLLRRPGHRVELTAPTAAGQKVLAWTTERRHPGIIYENHGTIGATVALLGKLNPSAVSVELAERRPALLVIAFGTNEGFDDGLDLAQYAARYRAAVATLRQHSPGAAVLVLGPPDGNRLPKDCAGQPNAGNACQSDAAASACAWSEPRHLAPVRELQRRIAAREGWAFWDWSAAMGGTCSIHDWIGQDPPLALADHVHLNKAGYGVTADALFADLMHAYDRWKQAHTVRR